MANPQLENGYTRIANELIDAIGQLDLNGTEYKVLLCILRQTYGYQRKNHKISTSFISVWANCSLRAVKKALKRLRELDVVKVINEDQRGIISILELNKDYDSWKSGEQICTGEQIDTSEQTCTSEQIDTRPVNDCALPPVHNRSPKERKTINKKYKENNICAFFEKAWQQYPKKKGKTAVSKKAKQELYEAGEDKVMAAIKAYSEEVDGRDEKYILHGSTFFNGRWKEYAPEIEPEAEQEQQDKPEDSKGYPGLTSEEYQEFKQLGIIDEDGGISFSKAIDCGKYEILRRAGIAV